MKQLVAQAYLMSTGKSKQEAQSDKEAIEKLADAMKKGQAKTDKVFPHLVELMRESSSGGVAQARSSSGAEESRFWNSWEKGWENFTKGGGEKGIAEFWRDITGSIGAWWEENAADLGKKFELAVKWFGIFRQGLTELVQFLWNGEITSVATWLAQEKGIDLTGVRVFFRDMWTTTKEVTFSVAQMIGLIDQDGNFDFAEFGGRIKNFVTKVGEAFSHLFDMLGHIGNLMKIASQVAEGGLLGLFNPLSDSAKAQRGAISSMLGAIASFGKATTSAAGSMVSLGTPVDNSPPQRAYVEGPHTAASLNNMFVASRLHGESGFSGAPIRRWSPRPGQAITNEAEGLRESTSIGQLGASLLPQQAIKNTHDINVNLTVNGDPAHIKGLALDAVAQELAHRIPLIVDYSLNTKLNSAMPGAPKL